jgi:CBS domain-containing protein
VQPVCNEDGDVVGLLDITKVFHSSLEKLERAYGSSAQLYSALEGVQSEWSGANAALVAYVQQIRESMAAPEIGTLLDARTAAVTVNVKSSVREAAKLMHDHRTTAVIVLDAPVYGEESPKIAGIFTSKDVVLRVIAAGLDARTCSVVRVMTPHPDTAFPDTTIQAALRKMHGESSGFDLHAV